MLRRTPLAVQSWRLLMPFPSTLDSRAAVGRPLATTKPGAYHTIPVPGAGCQAPITVHWPRRSSAARAGQRSAGKGHLTGRPPSRIIYPRRVCLGADMGIVENTRVQVTAIPAVDGNGCRACALCVARSVCRGKQSSNRTPVSRRLSTRTAAMAARPASRPARLGRSAH